MGDGGGGFAAEFVDDGECDPGGGVRNAFKMERHFWQSLGVEVELGCLFTVASIDWLVSVFVFGLQARNQFLTKHPSYNIHLLSPLGQKKKTDLPFPPPKKKISNTPYPSHHPTHYQSPRVLQIGPPILANMPTTYTPYPSPFPSS